MSTVIKATFKIRRGKKEAWERNNPILAYGEPGFEVDTNRLKIGDGVTAWLQLEAIGEVDLEDIYNEIQKLNVIEEGFGEDSIKGVSATTAGQMAFAIVGIDITNQFYTLDSVEGLEVGMEVSIQLKLNYDNCGTITQIDGNNVYLSEFKYTEGEDVLQENSSLRVPSRPELGTLRFGTGAVAFGSETSALAIGSFATGWNTKAEGKYSIAAGNTNTAGYAAASFGRDNNSKGHYSFTTGRYNDADGYYSTALGFDNTVNSTSDYTKANGASTAIGKHNKVNAIGTTAVGQELVSSVDGQTVLGKYNKEDENAAFIVGAGTPTSRKNVFSATADGAISEGTDTVSIGNGAHAEGYMSNVLRYDSANNKFIGATGGHAEGRATNSLGHGAHAEGGYNDQASATLILTGNANVTTYTYSTSNNGQIPIVGLAVNGRTIKSVNTTNKTVTFDCTLDEAKAYSNRLCLMSTTAAAPNAHAEGGLTLAKGVASHAGGTKSQALKDHSFAHGNNVIANAASQFAVGQYNDTETTEDAVFVVGNGTNNANRKNAVVVGKNGEMWVDGLVIGENKDKVAIDADLDTKANKVTGAAKKDLMSEVQNNDYESTLTYTLNSSDDVIHITTESEAWDWEINVGNLWVSSGDVGSFNEFTFPANAIPGDFDGMLETEWVSGSQVTIYIRETSIIDAYVNVNLNIDLIDVYKSLENTSNDLKDLNKSKTDKEYVDTELEKKANKVVGYENENISFDNEPNEQNEYILTCTLTSEYDKIYIDSYNQINNWGIMVGDFSFFEGFEKIDTSFVFPDDIYSVLEKLNYNSSQLTEEWKAGTEVTFKSYEQAFMNAYLAKGALLDLEDINNNLHQVIDDKIAAINNPIINTLNETKNVFSLEEGKYICGANASLTWECMDQTLDPADWNSGTISLGYGDIVSVKISESENGLRQIYIRVRNNFYDADADLVTSYSFSINPENGQFYEGNTVETYVRLPQITIADEGKILKVVEGRIQLVSE